MRNDNVPLHHPSDDEQGSPEHYRRTVERPEPVCPGAPTKNNRRLRPPSPDPPPPPPPPGRNYDDNNNHRDNEQQWVLHDASEVYGTTMRPRRLFQFGNDDDGRQNQQQQQQQQQWRRWRHQRPPNDVDSPTIGDGIMNDGPMMRQRGGGRTTATTPALILPETPERAGRDDDRWQPETPERTPSSRRHGRGRHHHLLQRTPRDEYGDVADRHEGPTSP